MTAGSAMDGHAKAQQLQGLQHYLCGSVAAFTNIVLTFPLHKAQFRQQLFGIRVCEAVRQLRGDGLKVLYRGLLPPLLQKSCTAALMFGLYEDLSRMLPRTFPVQARSDSADLMLCSLAAVLAGSAEAILTPFERVQTLLQDSRHHGHFRNTPHAFRVLLQEHGPRELYRGLVPILLRNGPSNALFFGLRDPIKHHLPQAKSNVGHLINDFICGGVLGAGLGIIFYPLNVVKSQAQAQVGGEFRSSWSILVMIVREREGKVIRLFRGVHLNYHRSILSWGIINATYELLLKVL
ncbi:solute carrier family 25 member 51-like [Denticeps clupeoides]|nr:solute carrier family 25 member 51-like [Denticeps clupeoides]